MTYRVRSRGYYRNGKSPLLVCLFTFCYTSCFNLSFSNLSLLTCLVVFDRPALEECYQGRVRATLEFAFTIDDFDNLVDPCHLYECCLGPEPSTFVLKKVTREKKSRFNLPFFLISSFFIRAQLSNLLFCRIGYQVQQR